MNTALTAFGLLLPTLAPAPALAGADRGVFYRECRPAGVPLRIVTVDVRNPRVRVGLVIPSRGLGHAESFAQLVARTRPVAAVTGTYFDVRTLRPVGDLVVGGRFIHRGMIGTALAVSESRQVRLRPRGRGKKYPGYETVVTSGPRLVANGCYVLNARREGFRDPALFRRNVRTAVGVTRDGKLLFINAVRPVTMGRLAQALVALGVRDAINLDGGTSTAFYYRGKILARPGRRLTNVLAAYEIGAPEPQVAQTPAPAPTSPAPAPAPATPPSPTVGAELAEP